MKAYEELISANEMPNYFLFFTVEPDTIDVNIHPTKTEIKFENEQAIWPIVLAAVKETLGKFCAAPSIDFDMADAPDIPALHQLVMLHLHRVDMTHHIARLKNPVEQGGHR